MRLYLVMKKVMDLNEERSTEAQVDFEPRVVVKLQQTQEANQPGNDEQNSGHTPCQKELSERAHILVLEFIITVDPAYKVTAKRSVKVMKFQPLLRL